MADHTASGQAAGYVYQCRYALLAALCEPDPSPQLQISIEQLDDVAFEEQGDPLARLQTKHHINARASLTDACADLWKTLGIWATEIATKPEVLGRIKLLLITTASAPAGSAAALLRKSERDEQRALQRLREVALSSDNKANASAYRAFGELVPAAQSGLLTAVEIVDGSHHLVDLDMPLLHELRRMGQTSQLKEILERVEGWWWARVYQALTDRARSRIAIIELESALDDIREGFRRANLPVDFAFVDPSPEHMAAYETTAFVRQVRLVDDTTEAVMRAKRNYYRAFEQRSRWLRELLIVNDEITRFDKMLIEEIEPHTAAMMAELAGARRDAGAKRQAGAKLLHWATTAAMFPLRNVTQRFLTLGSYHILADDLRVGWHPNYRDHFPPPAGECHRSNLGDDKEGCP
jgi:ABC-3C protein